MAALFCLLLVFMLTISSSVAYRHLDGYAD